MDTKTELKPVDYNVTEEAIEALRVKYANPKRPESKEELAVLGKGINEVRKLRTTVEKRRKELKAEALAYGRMVDSTAKNITSKLLEIEEPMKAIKKEIEEEEERREAERVRDIKEKMETMRGLPLKASCMEVEGISSMIENLLSWEITCWEFGEFKLDAQKIKETAIAALNEILTRKKEDEENRKRAEQARLEAEERMKAAREKEQALEEERKRLAQEAKAANEKAEAERKKLAAEVAALRRAEADRKEKQEQWRNPIKQKGYVAPDPVKPKPASPEQPSPINAPLDTDLARLKKGWRATTNAIKRQGAPESPTEFLFRILDRCLRASIEQIDWHKMPEEDRYFLNEVYDILGIE